MSADGKAPGGASAGLAVALLSEALGTALLVGVGLSFVVLDFGTGSPVMRWIPSAPARLALTGFLFGSTGATLALSAIGKHSGAHVNPAVTLAFVLTRTMRAPHGAGYVLAQLAGAALGALPLLAWGRLGRSVDLGATTPGPGIGAGLALGGEAATTFVMLALVLAFLRRASLRRFTPAIFPPLYAVMVWLEAPISGTSTNPARSFGPALVSGEWRGFWIYCVGPTLGCLAAVGFHRLPVLRLAELEVAKLYHFHHDPHGLFHRKRGRHAMG